MTRRAPRIAVLALVGLVALTAGAGLFAPLDAVALDAFFRLRGERPAPSGIVIVAIDDAFLETYQTRVGDLDRRFIARAVDALQRAGARAIGVDLFFPEPAAGDDELAAALGRAGAVLPHIPAAPLGTAGALWLSTETLSVDDRIPYNPQLQRLPRGVALLEPDGRRFRAALPFRDGALPSFPLALALRAGAGGAVTGIGDEDARAAQRPRLIGYRGADAFPTLSLVDVVRGDFAFGAVQDRIVLLGVEAIGAADRLVTPYGPMAGVEANANVLATLLGGGPAELPPLPLAALTFLTGLVGGAAGSGRRARWSVPLLAAALLGGAALLFAFDLFVPPTGPLAALLVAAAAAAAGHVRALDRRLGRGLADLLGTAATLRSGDRRAGAAGLSSGPDDAGGAAQRSAADHADRRSAAASLDALRRTVGARSALLLDGDLELWSGEPDARLERTAAAAAGRITAPLPPADPADDPAHLALPLEGDPPQNGPRGALAVALEPGAADAGAIRTALRATRDGLGQLRRYDALQREVADLDLWPWRLRSLHRKVAAVERIAHLMGLHERWRLGILDGLPLPLFVAEPSGRLLYRNAAAAALFGAHADVVSALAARLRLPEARVREDVLAALAGATLELITAERESGRPRLLTLRSAALEPGVVSLVGALGDLRALSETERRRDDLTSLLIHDVRGGLSNMLGLAELLDHRAAEASGGSRGRDGRDPLSLFQREAERVLEMIEGLPLAARAEAPAVALDPTPFDLALRLREAVAAAGLAAARKGVALAVSAPDALDATLDRALVGRAVDNLLSNAVKYSPEGTRTSVRLEVRGDDRLELVVADEGYGLDPEQQRRVFERDYRVPDGPHARERGSGLGLYVVRQVAEAHGGRVTVASQPGVGSTFRLELPRRVAMPGLERRA